MYIGTGGAPEGVLAAAALRCIGGQMQCRLILDSEEKRERAHKMGVTDPKMIYGIEDMARATACSRPPASPPARCCRASSSART
jgi:fructose-1,6-bisphosphatase II / sedoheptulose-1,7-bisphosphatase